MKIEGKYYLESSEEALDTMQLLEDKILSNSILRKSIRRMDICFQKYLRDDNGEILAGVILTKTI